MTPKEKAEELVGKYVSFSKGKILFQLTMESAKQSALIAVDEILEADWFIPTLKDKINWDIFWQQVKKEIEQL